MTATMHMYPLGDIGVALVGTFCIWVADKIPNGFASGIGSARFEITKVFFVVGAVLLILSLLDLVTWKGAIWQR